MSEMDDITQQTGRTFRQILDIAHSWYQRKRLRRNNSGDAPVKLTRGQRKELAAHLEHQIGAQRIAQSWYAHRVSEYQDARNQLWNERLENGADREDPRVNAAIGEQLSGMRYSIEATIHESALTLEERGQVVQALDALDESPRIRVRGVFHELNPRTALEARERAHASQRRIFDRQQAAACEVAVQRAQLAYRSDPANLASETAELRRRIAALESGRRDPAGIDTTPFVASVGPSELIGRTQESELAGTPHQQRPRTGPAFATAAEAYAWAEEQLDTYQAGQRRDGEFTAVVWDRRDPVNTAQAAVGPLGMVTDEVHQWRRDDYMDHPPKRQQTPALRTAPAADPVPAQPLDPRLAELERQVKELVDAREQQTRQIAVLTRGVDAVTSDRDNHRTRLDTAEAQVQALRNTNTGQTAEIKALREQLASVGADRDRYKAERDEAVQKLVQATPARDRFGSYERVAAEQAAASESNGNGRQRAQGNGYERSR